VHAFVLMGNHYHLLLETPEANLVAGMKWFQGTYTQRFNSRNKRWGHLFQGRYKALNVDGRSGDYFSTVAGYIHLNPARAGLVCASSGRLDDYCWSSYPLYLNPLRRPDWLGVDRVLGNYQWVDDENGRGLFGDYMQSRLRELASSADPRDFDPAWKQIRRGWFLGDDRFRQELMDRMDQALAGKQRASFSGAAVRSHDEQAAERLVLAGMDRLGLVEDQLKKMRKNCPEKYAIAWLVRRNTCIKNGWIATRLHMGKATNFSTFLKRMEAGEFGGVYFDQVKTLYNGTDPKGSDPKG
jgi:putative transposase